MDPINNDVQHATLSEAETAKGIKDKAQELASTVTAKASEATHRVGEQMETLAGKVRTSSASAEGALNTASTSVADKLEGAGSYLQEKGFDNMLEDLTALVRRYLIQSPLIDI